ncbi:MAG: hypothetical protein BWX71_02427 [Deltaproteobacteria bacterium ADurb.Bin072]|nr:MAG: hypothetical protein BWX71_02427 [Deltaproteobacteria bacterium ADurb.Bin072]
MPFFSISSTFLGTFFFIFFMISTDSFTPTASQDSKGPRAWLYPHFMALSMAVIFSQISGTLLAA